MALFEISLKPTDRQLRQFGGICVLAVPFITWLWTDNTNAVKWAAAIGAMLGVLGVVAPRILKPVFIGLTLLTIPIGIVVGELILLTIFFGLFFPMAILFRIMGRDALRRRRPGAATTFWLPRSQPSSVRRYYQQS